MSEWKDIDTVKAYVSRTTDPEVNWYEYEVNFPDLFRLIPKNTETLLDFGCGTGELTKKISETVNSVTGSDIEPMISSAKNKNPNLKFIEWDGKVLKSEIGIFDVVFCKLVLQFIDDLENVIFNFSRILNKDGCVIVSLPNPENISKNFNLDKNKTSKYLDEIGKTGIKINPTYRSEKEYISIFTKAGFEVLDVSKPLVSDEILQKHQISKEYNDMPRRLNFKLKLSPKF